VAAYYNEIDPYAAQWLRNLIAAGHIASGEVDERSILDVRPDDLRGFTQCHFFAGIGVWSHALRRAGWPDDRPVWTGSCPCQPFSVAGLGGGMDDQRHLWPHWFHLIDQCLPGTVFGEQVEAAIRHGWLDLVQSDMEGIGYAFAPIGLPAAGFGAPQVRQRVWFAAELADTYKCGCERQGGGCTEQKQRITECGLSSILAHFSCERCGKEGASIGRQAQRSCERGEHGKLADVCSIGRNSCGNLDGEHDGDELAPSSEVSPCTLAHSLDAGSQGRIRGGENERRQDQSGHAGCGGSTGDARETNGFWRDADWLFCKDGKWRPVEPGTFPLVNGATARVGRLRAYGNAIVAQVAEEMIRAYMECRP